MSFLIDDERPKRLISGPRMISTALLTGKPEVLITKASKKIKATPVSILSKKDQAKKDSKSAISSAIDALLETKPSKKVIREYFKERVKSLCA
jgi:hypothetical protein